MSENFPGLVTAAQHQRAAAYHRIVAAKDGVLIWSTLDPFAARRDDQVLQPMSTMTKKPPRVELGTVMKTCSCGKRNLSHFSVCFNCGQPIRSTS
jgi:hypothetical protein